jgi:hypothetical protein
MITRLNQAQKHEIDMWNPEASFCVAVQNPKKRLEESPIGLISFIITNMYF